MGAHRVWVHTCDLDHPQALANYAARGFHLYDTVQDLEEVPDEPLQPWPGANADLLAVSRPDPPPHDNHGQGEHRPRNGAR
jgi:hypothetical protein